MSAPIGSPGNRPIRLPQSTPVQGGSPAAPAAAHTPRAPVDPHLSDYSQTDRLRTQIGEQARSNPSFYGTLVEGVNGLLQRGGFGISPASHGSVMENLEGVSRGTMSQSRAHFRESWTFAQDALSSYSRGRFVQGEMERFGAALNLVGGVGMSAVEGAQWTFQQARQGARSLLGY